MQFFFATDAGENKLVRLSMKFFHPSLIFTGKEGADQSEWTT
jgi:hypothetical protein